MKSQLEFAALDWPWFKIIILSWIDNPMQQTQVGIPFWIKRSVGRVYSCSIHRCSLLTNSDFDQQDLILPDQQGNSDGSPAKINCLRHQHRRTCSDWNSSGLQDYHTKCFILHKIIYEMNFQPLTVEILKTYFCSNFRLKKCNHTSSHCRIPYASAHSHSHSYWSSKEGSFRLQSRSQGWSWLLFLPIRVGVRTE